MIAPTASVDKRALEHLGDLSAQAEDLRELVQEAALEAKPVHELERGIFACLPGCRSP